MSTFSLNELQKLTGIDIPVQELQLTIRQPRVNEIALIGEQEYFIALLTFCLNSKEIKSSIPLDPWEIFTQSLDQQIPGVKSTRTLIKNFLQLFFLHPAILGPRSIIIQTGTDDIININEANFEILQDVIAAVGGKELLNANGDDFKPANKRAAEIAEKMRKARERLAKQKPQSKEKGLLSKYIRIVATKTAHTIDQVSNMTLLQLSEISQTYLDWEEFMIEVKSALAGAKNENGITHWTIRKENPSNFGVV